MAFLNGFTWSAEEEQHQQKSRRSMGLTITAELDERIEKCEEILSGNPESLIFAALSDAYRKKGDLAKAFHVCSWGLKLHSEYGPGHLVMAKINFERGMYSEAEKELDLAVKSDGKTRTSELLLAHILYKKNQIQEAKKILEELKVNDPDNPTVNELLDAIQQGVEAEKNYYDTVAVEERWNIDKISDLKEAVGYLKSLPGILGAMVMGEEGSIQESKLNPKFKKELLGAAVSDITRRVDEGITGIDLGKYERITVEGLNLELWINRFDHQTLVLCCSADANLGALKVRVWETLEQLSLNIG
jgi:predicted regulator of Ras-like GTPase activity (Roadblock/LC7/MglB family)/predicted negative regulator of RcsB-dependent stress response